MAIATDEWVDSRSAAELLGVSDLRIVQRLARRGHVGVKAIPGSRPRYKRADLERIASESVHRATVEPGAGHEPA